MDGDENTLRVMSNTFCYRDAAAGGGDTGVITRLVIEKQGWHWTTVLRPILESCRKTVRCIEFMDVNNISDFFMLHIHFEQLQAIRFIPQELETIFVVTERSDLELDWYYYPRLLRVEGLEISFFLEPTKYGGLTESSNPSLLALLCVNEQKLHSACALCLCFRGQFGSKPLAKMVAQYLLQLDSSLWYVALPKVQKMENPRLIPFADPVYTERVDKKVHQYNSVAQKIQSKKRNINTKKRAITCLEQTIQKRKQEIEQYQQTLQKHEKNLKKIRGDIDQMKMVHKMFK